MDKEFEKRLDFDSDTFEEMKRDMNFVLQRLIGNMQENVDVLIADWNEMYFNQMENFPQSKFKDMVDASSSAFSEIENGMTYSAPPTDGNLSKSSYWK